MDLGETLRQYLTDSQKETASEIAGYVWFDRQNEARFREGLEPLAYSVKLGLRHQIQSYFTTMEKIYFDDLLLKTRHLLKDLHLDGSVLDYHDTMTSLNDLNIILPEKAFDIIERLSVEGYDASDFAVANRYGCFFFVLKVGARWLRLMPLLKR